MLRFVDVEEGALHDRWLTDERALEADQSVRLKVLSHLLRHRFQEAAAQVQEIERGAPITRHRFCEGEGDCVQLSH